MEIRVKNIHPYQEVEIVDNDVVWASGLLSTKEALEMANKLMDAAAELLK